MTLLILPALLLFFLALCIVERSDILLGNQKLLGITFRQSVFGIGLLFCCQLLSIFNTEILYSWKLPYAQFIESRLCSFMNRNLFPMCLQKLFAVTGFAVFLINGTRLGIIDDMLFQSADLRQSLFRLMNRGEKGVPFGSLLLHKLVQLLHAFNLMITQEQQRFRHLLQVINRCPALISGTFVLQLALDINDKIEGADICVAVTFFSRLVFLLPEEMSSQIRLGIAFLQRGQADEAGLIFPFDRDVLSVFYLIIQCL